jgi:hypothetical protein
MGATPLTIKNLRTAAHQLEVSEGYELPGEAMAKKI